MGRAWMPLYVGDYLRDTRDLNTLQHGAYLLLIMHYWQHNALPSDEARLAAIAGLSVAQWRRIREPVAAKFAEGWRHKRIEAELEKTDRAFMQRRLAGRNGGIKSGIARAVARGEAIIAGEAQAERMLARRSSGREAGGAAGGERPRTNHNHRSISFSSSESPPSPSARTGEGGARNERAAVAGKPATQWSRQELDALFARRTLTAGADASAPAPDAPSPDAAPNLETGG
jgi:hypothetical protein